MAGRIAPDLPCERRTSWGRRASRSTSWGWGPTVRSEHMIGPHRARRAKDGKGALMSKNELKERVYAAIDRRAEQIVGIGERIRKHPELGFKEVKTARLVEETFSALGLKPKTALALTGVRAEAAGRGGDGPTFALLGELDGLVVAGHPEGDPATGAAHACGHNAQVAALLGAAMGLLDSDALGALSGRL